MRGGALAGLLAAMLSVGACGGGGPPEQATLVRDLPHRTSWEDLSAVFDERVRRRFPLGSAEEELRRTLSAQGFGQPYALEAEDVRGSPELGPAKLSDLEWSEFPCNMRATVIWATDTGGLLTHVRGYYGEAGCL